ncbi:aminoglycoside phosphotransferase family protein [Spirochaeta isovalerica]|uniref:Aminoglycoside phosphotransferase (APT) family kinase protein n=1 Tax=Spirochaeta isovalerica TaxID=150 RepID=A0A841REK2_9SPIO|nr:aminoglycoside phosphotransferase family protein [Spirochaeta isovalerica]MBB6482505.1 aminoglycoside phosphotransferase (APT) family kinase protein [Spirochaeta isovalerica]
MESTTKSSLTERQIRGIFQNIDKIDSIKELKDGCYNTSYAVRSESNLEYVLKVSPPEDVPILTYEQNLMETEVQFHKKVMEMKTLPVAKILKDDFSRSSVPYNFFIMEKLKGRPLDKFEEITTEERKSVSSDLAGYMAEMHKITGTRYGYPFMTENSNHDYYTAFRRMVELLLSDGERRGAALPLSQEQIFNLLEKYRESFSGTGQPVFVHFDLWDGNIFVEKRGNSIQISGLIDFERGFYADPAADFSQVQGYIDLRENGWFFDKYNRHALMPFTADEKAFNRIFLFRFYLFLIMIVESYYRDVNGSFDWQLQWSREEFLKLYNQLK